MIAFESGPLVILRYSEGSGFSGESARSFGVPQDDKLTFLDDDMRDCRTYRTTSPFSLSRIAISISGFVSPAMNSGNEYPMIRQALAYSFGLDSQDFVVAYETDDLPAFGDLVRALRSTESRRSTVSDTPILLGIHRPMDEILAMLGAF